MSYTDPSCLWSHRLVSWYLLQPYYITILYICRSNISTLLTITITVMVMMKLESLKKEIKQSAIRNVSSFSPYQAYF